MILGAGHMIFQHFTLTVLQRPQLISITNQLREKGMGEKHSPHTYRIIAVPRQGPTKGFSGLMYQFSSLPPNIVEFQGSDHSLYRKGWLKFLSLVMSHKEPLQQTTRSTYGHPANFKLYIFPLHISCIRA